MNCVNCNGEAFQSALKYSLWLLTLRIQALGKALEGMRPCPTLHVMLWKLGPKEGMRLD